MEKTTTSPSNFCECGHSQAHHIDNKYQCDNCVCTDFRIIDAVAYINLDFIELSKEDAMVLYKLVEHQYIHYDNTAAHELIKRISEFAHNK